MCICINGSIMLPRFHRVNGRATIRSDCAAVCLQCHPTAENTYDPRLPWWDKLQFSLSGQWEDRWKQSEIEKWCKDLFKACENESRSAAPQFPIRWPADKDSLVESLVRRGNWPQQLVINERKRS